ncbi:MAG TPA: hypothetical protein VF400_02905, partial [Anaeromyxobacteraceae bacterium]
RRLGDFAEGRDQAVDEHEDEQDAHRSLIPYRLGAGHGTPAVEPRAAPVSWPLEPVSLSIKG